MAVSSIVTGEIDIVPPLAWSEVKASGFMVMPDRTPVPAAGRLVTLSWVEELIDRAEGVMHRFTFPSIQAATPDIATADRATFQAQIAEVIAAFPTHVFGGVSRAIRFRGNAIDDQWRVRLDVDGVTVRRQVATLTWTDA